MRARSARPVVLSPRRKPRIGLATSRATILRTLVHSPRVHSTARRGHAADEATFLAIGPGAQWWLISAAAAGTARMRTKMIAAVALAKIYGCGPVDRALATAAELCRSTQEVLSGAAAS